MKTPLILALFAFLIIGCTPSSPKESYARINDMNKFMGKLWFLPPDSITVYVEKTDLEMDSFSEKEKGFYYLLKTQYAKRLNNLSLQKKWARQGIQHSTIAKDDTTLIPLFMVMSDFHFQRNNHDSAIYYGHQAMLLADSINYHLAASAMTISNAYHGMSNHEKANHYLKIGLLDENDQIYKGSLYTNLALNYANLKDSSESQKYFSKAIAFHQQRGDNFNLCITYGNLAYQHFKNEDYVSGIQLIEEAIEIGNHHQIDIASNYDIYGDLLRKSNQPKKAEVAYQTSIRLFKEEGNSLNIIAPYKGITKLLQSQNRLNEAIVYMDTVNDLTAQKYKDQLLDNVTETEFQIRDERINSLKSQKNLEEERGRTKNWLILATVIGTLITILVIYLYFSRKQFKQRVEIMMMKQRLMRTQMTPHFIFNAISSLQGLIITGNKEKANDYLGRFAQILRGSIENSTKQWVPISDEIKVINNYLVLQQIRYSSNFDFKIQIDENAIELLIPPMIIQPFVENAIEHGLKPLKQDGLVNIRLTVDQQSSSSIRCEIKDNGVGIENSVSSSTKKSLSTSIIRDQLKILEKKNNTSAKLSIDSNEHGTTISLLIPYQEFD